MDSPLIVVIDNYDSFTYNLVQYLAALGAEVKVFRNDHITVPEIQALQPDGVVISPGPGRPEDAGISLALIAEIGSTVPLLGVCLGHQSIGQVFGGNIVSAPTLMHGKTSEIYHRGMGVFAGLPMPFTATRYHSLVIDKNSCPEVLEITAWTEDLVELGAIAGRVFDWVIIKEDDDRRGRDLGEAAELIRAGLIQVGSACRWEMILDETTAIRTALSKAPAGSLVVIFPEKVQRALELIRADGPGLPAQP